MKEVRLDSVTSASEMPTLAPASKSAVLARRKKNSATAADDSSACDSALVQPRKALSTCKRFSL
jgi:hypothetical protein